MSPVIPAMAPCAICTAYTNKGVRAFTLCSVCERETAPILKRILRDGIAGQYVLGTRAGEKFLFDRVTLNGVFLTLRAYFTVAEPAVESRFGPGTVFSKQARDVDVAIREITWIYREDA